MRLVSQVVSVSVALALTSACGAAKKDDKANKTPELTAEQEQKRDEHVSEVPSAVIVRVPVDASGEPTGAPEMRVVKAASALETKEDASEAFGAGEAPAAFHSATDELDTESSAQSWSSVD